MRRTRTLLLTAALGLLACATCFGQQTSGSTAPQSSQPAVSQQDSELLKLLEITKIRLDSANEKNVLLEGRLADKDTVIAALQGALKGRDGQLDDAKAALKDRREVNTGDARVLAMTQAQLDKADARIAQLEHPSFLASVFDRRTAYGLIGGYGACKAFGSGSSPVRIGGQSLQFASGPQLDYSRYQVGSWERTREALKLIRTKN